MFRFPLSQKFSFYQQLSIAIDTHPEKLRAYLNHFHQEPQDGTFYRRNRL